VIDLHSPLHRHFTVRDYACLLEKTTIAAIAKVTALADGISIQGFTTENPGVWVQHSRTGLRSEGQSLPPGEERKIAALGVHLSRHVTGLGVAVNVGMPVSGPEERNPWSRIVACGLEDKGVTSVMTELYGARQNGADVGLSEELQDDLRKAWAAEFEQRLKINHDLDTPTGVGIGTNTIQQELDQSILQHGKYSASCWNDGSKLHDS
jgi:lipoyl(octanoyl) transferase 2